MMNLNYTLSIHELLKHCFEVATHFYELLNAFVPVRSVFFFVTFSFLDDVSPVGVSSEKRLLADDD